MRAAARIACLFLAVGGLGSPAALGGNATDRPPVQLWEEFPLEQTPTQPQTPTQRVTPDVRPQAGRVPTKVASEQDERSLAPALQVLMLIGAAAALALLSAMLSHARPLWSSTMVAFAGRHVRDYARPSGRDRDPPPPGTTVDRIEKWVTRTRRPNAAPDDHAIDEVVAAEVVELPLQEGEPEAPAPAEKERPVDALEDDHVRRSRAAWQAMLSRARPLWSSTMAAFAGRHVRDDARATERDRDPPPPPETTVDRIEQSLGRTQRRDAAPDDHGTDEGVAAEVVELPLPHTGPQPAAPSEQPSPATQPFDTDRAKDSENTVTNRADELEQSLEVFRRAAAHAGQPEHVRELRAGKPRATGANRETASEEVAEPLPDEGEPGPRAPAQLPRAVPEPIPGPNDEGDPLSALDAVEQTRKPTPASAERAMMERCAIAVWRGYVKSRFFATRGEGDAIALSMLFRAPGGQAPERTPQSEQALAELLERLDQLGWAVIAEGPQWFDRRLERPR
jgi:hypothetical protein